MLGIGSKLGARSVVRTAVPADATAIQHLVNGIFGEYGLAIAVDGVDEHLAQPAGYFHARGGEFWVVEDGGRIVATVGALPNDSETVELKALYVYPSIRRQGWGRRLTKLVMDYARTTSKKRVLLWSDTRFTDAHRLYRGLGFRQFGRRELHDLYNSSEYGFECEQTDSPG
jgi:putative acetyltransferase